LDINIPPTAAAPKVWLPFLPTPGHISTIAVFGKGEGYYLVIRGVENIEVLKNE
jgi:hypothetical protein